MNRDVVLMLLPPPTGKVEVITRRQTLTDIKKQIFHAHKVCAADYDKIAHVFLGNSDVGTLRDLFSFLKLNVRYKEESEKAQYTKSPAALLESGVADCKMYASFIGGVLDALNRQGANFDWYYAFASYPQTEHVFVIVDVNGKEYWVDPVMPNFDQRDPEPDKLELKKIGAMALMHISGVEQEHLPVNLRSSGRRTRISCDRPQMSGTGITDWMQANPFLTAAAAVAAIALISSFSGRKRRAV
jgi:hypothetical protein